MAYRGGSAPGRCALSAGFDRVPNGRHVSNGGMHYRAPAAGNGKGFVFLTSKMKPASAMPLFRPDILEQTPSDPVRKFLMLEGTLQNQEV